MPYTSFPQNKTELRKKIQLKQNSEIQGKVCLEISKIQKHTVLADGTFHQVAKCRTEIHSCLENQDKPLPPDTKLRASGIRNHFFHEHCSRN